MLVTALALYGVQNLVIWLASDLWPAPVHEVARLCAGAFSAAGQEELFARNAVKLAATAASMTWNYFGYRFYVFRN